MSLRKRILLYFFSSGIQFVLFKSILYSPMGHTLLGYNGRIFLFTVVSISCRC